MYKLLRDKNNEFQCEIKLVGASEKTAKVRLFLEGVGCEYSFGGIIEGTRCRVNMGKLKPYTSLLESGKIRLEVVADDTLFIPYESTYQLEESKSVTVEVVEPESDSKKPMVEVKVVEARPVSKPEPKQKNPIVEIKKYLEENTLYNGTMDGFKLAMKSKMHKEVFNSFCQKNKLDKAIVIKSLIK